MSEQSFVIGTRVLVREKGFQGIVAYQGTTDFAPGIWIGLVLDEPKGKNDGSVQGKVYFKCPDKHGIFVRPPQVSGLDDDTFSNTSGAGGDGASPQPGGSPAKDKSPSQESKIAVLTAKKGNIPTPSVIPKSRLPTPGSGPTSGRSPSFTNLKTNIRRESTAQSQSGLQRERSFIEKNFVETLKHPQVQVQPVMASPSQVTPSRKLTPELTGSPSFAAQAHSERLEEKVANIQNQQELQRCREEIQDLNEKLETMKIKRAKDQEKIKEYEKIRIQHDQLLEFKSRIMESQSALQKELQKARHDTREAIEAKEKHAEEMAELSETVEMATLDKEMAEEKAEALQLELETLKEKYEELQVDMDIMKAEIADDSGVGSGVSGESAKTTNFEMKQLQAQNEKLRETLVKMRDLSAHEKSELMRLTKDMEEKQGQNADLTKSNEKLKTQNEELEATISDLQEQVDAALGAEEMVENLTTKCLDLEDQYKALLEEKQDLEALHDMNEELQENAREVELELREEIDLLQAKIRESDRSRNTAYEIIADHEATIQKFRGLVNQVQDQNQNLRDALEKETNKPVAESSAAAEIIDFKKMFAETKAHSRAIDMELRQCEVEESRQHIKMLSLFMGDNFMSRGGDHEAILVLLLVPRMLWKISILTTQVKEKFASTDLVIDRSSIAKGPMSSVIERRIFGDSILHNLNCLTALMQQFETALNTCDPQTLLRIGTLYSEMAVHEKSVDFYIDLLRKDQLDENVPLETLEKSLHYFGQIYPLHLSGEKINHGKFLANHLKVFSSAADCITIAMSIAKSLSPDVGNYEGELGASFKSLEIDLNELRQTLKSVKRRLPQQLNDNRTSTEPVIVFSLGVAKELSEVTLTASALAKVFRTFGISCIQQAIISGEAEPTMPIVKVSEFLLSAVDRSFDLEPTGIDTISTTIKQILEKLNTFNKSLQDGEYDTDPAVAVSMWNTLPPIVARADVYKAELKDADTLRTKLKNMEMDIRDLQKSLKAKSDEISEMQIRKDKAEKRLMDSTKDNELVRDKLQRKIDDLQGLLERKEKEFNDTFNHLQKLLDSAESEKGELMNKLKKSTKKAVWEGITRQGLDTSELGDGDSTGPSLPNPVKDSPMLMQHVQDLQLALLDLKEKSYRRQGEELQLRMAKLKPIIVPKKLTRLQVQENDNHTPTPETCEKRDISKEETPTADILSKKVAHLQQRVVENLIAKNVVELSRRKIHGETAGTTTEVDAPRPSDQLMAQSLRSKKLEIEGEKLKMEIVRLIASKKPGGQIEADFCKFPSKDLARALSEHNYQVIGRIRIGQEPQFKKVPLLIGTKDLHLIHQKVIG